MRVHHLNCGSMRHVTPDDASPTLSAQRAVTHCVLIESESEGLILVDSGIGTHDISHPQSSLGDQFLKQSIPILDDSETAIAQVRALGYDADDVQHIVLTHLDLDHAGGIADFPQAKVHVSVDELRAASAPGFHPAELNRYRPLQWAHQPEWALFAPARAADWFGLDAAQTPDPLARSGLRLIPLGGHSAGHTGVAVKLDEASDESARWLLHAGDAYFYHGELDANMPRSTPGLGYLRDSTEVHRELRTGTSARLRDLRGRFGDQVDIFCAHDPWEFAQLKPAAS